MDFPAERDVDDEEERQIRRVEAPLDSEEDDAEGDEADEDVSDMSVGDVDSEDMELSGDERRRLRNHEQRSAVGPCGRRLCGRGERGRPRAE